MLIKFQWGDHEPVSGFVRFFFGFDEYVDVDLDATGMVMVPTRQGWLPDHARVNFFGPFWTGAIRSFSSYLVHVCHRGTGDIHWWRHLVGSDPSNSMAGNGIKIGVLDTPFTQAGSLSHVRCLNLEGRRARVGPPHIISHGQIVTELLGARRSGNGPDGVAPGAEIVAIDITYPNHPTEIDYGRFAPGIETLSFDHNCDLINLSGGAPRPDDEVVFQRSTLQLRQAVEDAFENGTLLIAAVGNEGLTSCAIPACFESVIGTGSIAQCGIAPPGSVMRFYEDQRRAQGLLGAYGSAHVFPVPDTVCGEGLNVVAPGAGIFVADAAGKLQEFEGTSFSSPIVVGILANALATDTAYDAKRGRSRSDHALGRLRELCFDLKLPQKYQGWGLPILKPQPI